MQFKKLLSENPSYDLVIYELTDELLPSLVDIERALAEDGRIPLLLIVRESMLGDLRVPASIHCDFVVHGASHEECSLRIRQLLWPGAEGSAGDFVSVDGMTINLATYQVAVNGEPVDFTYLEYALLAFLVTHPGRAMLSCGACGASTTSADPARSMSMSGAFAPSSVLSYRSDSRRFAASATSGTPRPFVFSA